MINAFGTGGPEGDHPGVAPRPTGRVESARSRAISSAGERSAHTGEVTGSIPVLPTKAVGRYQRTDIPGSGRNEKRWQEVLDLLAAHVDVIATVNIQHLESLADAVERIIGTRFRERIPTPSCCGPTRSNSSTRRRSSFASGCCTATSTRLTRSHTRSTTSSETDNLTALRELALRFLADRTEGRRCLDRRRVGRHELPRSASNDGGCAKQGR
jgi:hypothetical protein